MCVCVYSKGARYFYGLCSGIALYRSSSASLKSHIMYDLPFRGTNSRPGSISAECFQHSFLSMEYSCDHVRHKFENKQDKREEQVGDLSDGEMSGDLLE